jgi:hypothetical protein
MICAAIAEEVVAFAPERQLIVAWYFNAWCELAGSTRDLAVKGSRSSSLPLAASKSYRFKLKAACPSMEGSSIVKDIQLGYPLPTFRSTLGTSSAQSSFDRNNADSLMPTRIR